MFYLSTFLISCCHYCYLIGYNVTGFDFSTIGQRFTQGKSFVAAQRYWFYSLLISVYLSCCDLCSKFYVARYTHSFISIGEKHVEIKAENMNNANLPSNMTGDAVNLHNMDAPADPRNPFSRLARVFQKLWYRNGVTDVFRVCDEPSTICQYDEHDVKEMCIIPEQSSFRNFLNRQVYLGLSKFKTTFIKGDSICSFPISALICTTPSYATIASLANFYDYWNGTIKFRFILGSNDFTRGKIMVSLHYGVFSQTTVSTNWTTPGALDPHTVWHMIVDVSNPDRVVEVEIPYKSVYPCLRTNYDVFNQTTPTCDPSNSVGFINVSCYSPIVSANSSAASVTVSSFYSWGDDFRLYTDRSKGLVYSQTLMSPDPCSPSINYLNYMSMCSSIKDLISKPIHYSTVSFKAGGTLTPALPIYLPLNPALLSNNAEWTFAMSCFAGYKGSLRWIVRYYNPSGNTPVRTFVVPQSQLRNSTISFGAPPLAYLDDAYTNNPTATEPDLTSVVSMRWNRQAWADTASTATTAVYASKPCQIMHPITTPEVIFEIPYVLPHYRYIPAYPIPPNITFSALPSTGALYTPAIDEASSFLAALPMIDTINVANPGFLEVDVQAGDDFDFIHFTGGPTSAVVSSLNVKNGTTLNTYEDPRNRTLYTFPQF
jgi:hypothetical protein